MHVGHAQTAHHSLSESVETLREYYCDTYLFSLKERWGGNPRLQQLGVSQLNAIFACCVAMDGFLPLGLSPRFAVREYAWAIEN